MSGGSIDFFVSYNSADTKWAEWISWVLEAAGYRVWARSFAFHEARASCGAERAILAHKQNGGPLWEPPQSLSWI
jgi:hypothetical protein